ncbi:MAG: NADH-quinone oxidoreductase subunit D [Phycisphaeraceae bacterium]|nr:NADH-quinone oxidoreductase subunit D [Phycisphaerae bacterium]MBX3392063.1 NADH-quinone oxidoreductase subunit D [Phycisphaeraceae bacterium]HRJ49623.1 NADH-quinone oxidoreductase subunit D [Phycisphaerales bacterium]
MPYTLRPEDGLTVDADSARYVAGHVDTGDRWVLNFGPQHPATHTTLRLVLELDGERVARCTPHIGYLHSGFEKLGEHLDFNQYVTIVSRMDYLSPIHNDITWHLAVERLFGIDITPRCKVLRTIMNELGRIQNHLLCVAAAGLDLGALTGFLYGFNPREKIYDIMDFISGQRFHPDWTRVGGLMQDLPDEQTFKRMVKNLIREDLPVALRDIEGLLNRNRIFVDRTQGIGVISREEAINWSLSGPCARASGVARDLRKDMPYLCYQDNWDGQGAGAVGFNVAVATDGDTLCRYLVRLEEIKQSIGIIEQLIDAIPQGPVDTFADSKVVKPDKKDVYGSIEGLIQHFELIMSNRGWKAPVAEAYGWNEGPNGEQGFYIVSDGGPRAWRVKTRPACFINYQVMQKLTEGHMLADIVAILGSINVVAAELDR